MSTFNMVGNYTNGTSPLERLLTSWGFFRNPFGTIEADRERDLLPEFFVEVEGYDRIKGDESIITFAPQGGGKSALRIALSANAAPVVVGATTLAVEFTDFDRLVDRYYAGNTLSINDFVPELLCSGAAALLNALCDDPDHLQPFPRSADDRLIQAQRAKMLTPPHRSYLAQVLRQNHLLEAHALYRRLQALDSAFNAPEWLNFVNAVNQRQLGKVLDNTPLVNHPIARLLVDLNDYPDIPLQSQDSPIEQMRTLVRLARSAGFHTVIFLMDRLDERQETADRPDVQANILEPLLAHLGVLETPGLAFKFFLSRDTREVLLQRPTIRRDRLTDLAVTVSWDRNRLKQLLDNRLSTYSEGTWQDIVQLCRDVKVPGTNRLLGEWIESEMLQAAYGSPRRLLLAGQLLFQAHCELDPQLGPIGKEAWDQAKQQLDQRLPPILRISERRALAYTGDVEKALTHIEHNLLLNLAASGGQSNRTALGERVWGGMTSDQAIDQTVSRLRAKLGDNAIQPVYLVTVHGVGYRLKNYEIIP